VIVTGWWLLYRQWILLILFMLGMSGCDPLYQSYTFTEPIQTSLPIRVMADEVWITSIPAGADVYVQPYRPDILPSHTTDPAAYRGKTPLRFVLPPGSYWLEIALDVEVFSAYFTPPYDDAQFEPDGAASEALLFRPFTPGEKRRVLRYYRLEKQAAQGQTLIALFHPRGEELSRTLALYPQTEQYTLQADAFLKLLQRLQIPRELQETLLTLMQHGGKASWSQSDMYTVALEAQHDGIWGQIIALYTGVPKPEPLIPDGGGL
jgi:hypothetical protein